LKYLPTGERKRVKRSLINWLFLYLSMFNLMKSPQLSMVFFFFAKVTRNKGALPPPLRRALFAAVHTV